MPAPAAWATGSPPDSAKGPPWKSPLGSCLSREDGFGDDLDMPPVAAVDGTPHGTIDMALAQLRHGHDDLLGVWPRKRRA